MSGASDGSRDHNATSYSTETSNVCFSFSMWYSRDHNATSYSTETTSQHDQTPSISAAEIITLRAIALKPRRQRGRPNTYAAEIITLRAIALKLEGIRDNTKSREVSRDHNATSYSTETFWITTSASRIALQRS